MDPNALATLAGNPETIVTSSGQNDSGLFEANLRDERYLPFESKGAISAWTLEIDRATNAFDLGTISDVVLHLRYTARDGGDTFKTAVKNAMTTAGPTSALQLIDARAQFPDAWYRFLHPTSADPDAVLTLPLAEDQLAFLQGTDPLQITQVDVLSRWSSSATVTPSLALVLAAPGLAPSPSANLSLSVDSALGGLCKDTISSVTASPGAWTLTLRTSDVNALAAALVDTPPVGPKRLKADVLDGIWLLLHLKRGA